MKILIVKTSSLGDIVHAFPALALLKKKFPNAEIDWVVEKPFAALLEAHPSINQVIPIQTKKWRRSFFSHQTMSEVREVFSRLRKPYDLLFDLQGNAKSGIVTAMAKAKVKVGYGRHSVWEKPNLLFTNVKFDPPAEVNVRDENLSLVQQYFRTDERVEEYTLLRLQESEKQFLKRFLQNPYLQNARKIFVAPGSNWKNKQADMKTIIDFLLLLHHEKPSCFLLVYGNDSEQQMANEISTYLPASILVDKLSLPLLQNLMACMDLVIAMDSLPLHLAAAAGIPTFSIFGPSSAAKFAPPGKQHRAFQGSCPYQKQFTRRCDILRSCKTGACIKNIQADSLIKLYRQS